MRGGFGGLMAQAQKMQANIGRLQEELAVMEVEGTASNGAVKVLLTGKHECRRVSIDPAVIDPDDVEMLEDLIVLAINDSVKKIESISAERMKKATAGMPLPPGMKMPF